MLTGDNMVFLYITVIFFSLLGVITFIGQMYLAFYRVKNPSVKQSMVLTVKQSEESDVETEVKMALSRLGWLNRDDFDVITAVDCGLQPPSSEVCRELFSQHDIKMIKKEELLSIIDDGRKDK